MATTSGALNAGRAPAGHGGRHSGRWMVVLAAAAALALALLVGVIALRQRQADVTPAAVPAGPVSIPGQWLGTCRAGGSDCLPDEIIVPGVAPAGVSTSMQYRWDDYAAAPGWPRTVARPYTGTCRAGGSECLPDEAIAPGVAPAGPASIPGPWRGTCRAGSSDCLPGDE